MALFDFLNFLVTAPDVASVTDTDIAKELYDVTLVDVSKTYHQAGKPDLVALKNVSLNIARGEFFALLGPSGCGKTTTLRLLAGFEAADEGGVYIQGKQVNDVPAFERPVNTVFQDYALFPHMSVLDNVMFGLRMARVSKAEARTRAREALELVRLTEVETRKPRQLSGGQRQRVALARALVNKPKVLLLDEPLAALDLKLRQAMQLELKHMQMKLGITFVLVTHDQEEAMTMADRIAVMSDGEILQVGTPQEIYEAPVNRFVAEFIGDSNFMPATVTNISVEQVEVSLANDSRFSIKTSFEISPNQSLMLAVRPEKIALAVEYPIAENSSKEIVMLSGIIKEVVYIGTATLYTLDLPDIGQKLVARVHDQNIYKQSNTTEKNIFQVGEYVVAYWHQDSMTLLVD